MDENAIGLGRRTHLSNEEKVKKLVGLIVIVILVIGGIVAWNKYDLIYGSSLNSRSGDLILNIPTGTTFEELLILLQNDGLIDDLESFEWVCELKDFSAVKAGRYRLRPGMSNNGLVNKLRIGDQEAVKVQFSSARTLEQLAGRMSTSLEIDSVDLIAHFYDPGVPAKYGFNKETFRTMFLPNTYEVWWNVSAEDLVARMAKEYKAFWSDERLNKARALNLSQSEVTILASIVKAETSKKDEAPKIAGVYCNRLRINMALQADPTLIYALGDFTIKRVLDRHKQVKSPYNTYKYPGLPPGPINIPQAVYIDAVLNREKHNFLYFCAKPELDGYHNFAKTYRQHLIHAKAYQRELNQRRVYR